VIGASESIFVFSIILSTATNWVAISADAVIANGNKFVILTIENRTNPTVALSIECNQN